MRSEQIQVLLGIQDAEKGSQEWQMGRGYASEALQLLGRPKEAAEHLQSALEAIIEASSQDQVIHGLLPGWRHDALTPEFTTASEEILPMSGGRRLALVLSCTTYLSCMTLNLKKSAVVAKLDEPASLSAAKPLPDRSKTGHSLCSCESSRAQARCCRGSWTRVQEVEQRSQGINCRQLMPCTRSK